MPVDSGTGHGKAVDGQTGVESDTHTNCDRNLNLSVEPELSSNQDLSTSQEKEAEAEGKLKPLTFHIPEDNLRAAMLASPNTRASYWSAKLYQGPNGELLSTHYCKSLEVAERVAQYFLKEKVVGFDIEWKPRGNPRSIKQNASLIQLACENRIALFHISLFSGTKAEQLMPPSLRLVLESPDITKVGVAVKGDFTRLQKYLGIQAQGVFELSRLHNLVEWYAADPSKVSNKLVGLATQVHQHLQLPLYKGEQLVDEPETTSSVRESDWSLPLDVQQVHYAAADAYAGFRLYHRLEWKRAQLKPTPPAVRLCDYDSKPLPKSKEPRKRVKAATKSKEVAKTDLKPPVDPPEEDQEGVEDDESYETAEEELVDSHQLEDSSFAPPPKASRGTEGQACAATEPEPENDKSTELDHTTSQAYKRVGRINLSGLKGPDPGYPTLPPMSQEKARKPSSDQLSDSPSGTPSETNDEQDMHPLQPARTYSVSEDDEFADSELEEALGNMDLDSNGDLKENYKAFDLGSGAQDHQQAPTNLSVDLVEDVLEDDIPEAVQESSTAEVADLSDYNSTTPKPQGLEEQTSPVVMAPHPTTPTEQASRTPEYDLATSWAQEHLQSTVPSPTSTTPSRIRATMPHLRAYHMWYHQKLPIEGIAQQLREPALSHITAVNYVLQAVSLERLEYETGSLKRLMLRMPSGMRTRWKSLAEKVGALD
jgi:hypothetical protein